MIEQKEFKGAILGELPVLRISNKNYIFPQQIIKDFWECAEHKKGRELNPKNDEEYKKLREDAISQLVGFGKQANVDIEYLFKKIKISVPVLVEKIKVRKYLFMAIDAFVIVNN